MTSGSWFVRRVDSGILLAAIIVAVVFWVAYDDGSYGLPSRAGLAIGVWWAVIVGLALGLLTLTRLPRAVLVVGGLNAGLALWTLASVFWAPSAEDAFNEFNRVSLYLGVYVLVVLAAVRATVARWSDGLAIGIAAVAAVALVSRLFPGSFDDRGLATLLPSASTRLSFPLGYWNGLAVFAGLSVPLFLRSALVARSATGRGLALAPIPALASVIYLASSRGGVVTAAVGMSAFVVLTERRWDAAAAIGVSGVASAVAVAVLVDRTELVNGPLGTELVRGQGRSAAVLIALLCVVTASVYGFAGRLLSPRLKPRRWVGQFAAGLAVLSLVVGIVASHPLARFDEFKVSPARAESIQNGDFVTAHLLSGNGSGRWQFWSSAIDEWRQHPFIGGGAGSYGHWWAEHASFTYFLRDAHSLYLEMLGELGIVGFILALALALAGVVVGTRRSLRTTGEARITTAALTAVFAGYAVAVGFDWMWELTAVSVIGFVALALLSGPATEVYEPLVTAGPAMSRGPGARHRVALGVATGLAAWILICAEAIPLLADREIARSRSAVGRHDLAEAAVAARSARDIQPWAATPYLQLALVREEQGALPEARTWIEKAIERDSRDWQLWLVAARLDTKLGDVAAADRTLHRAAQLNPRSPLFEGLVTLPGARP